MKYWKRRYKVAFPEVGYIFANTLRVKFSIDKDTTKQTNKSKVEIYNLSKETRDALEKPDIKVEVYAGYEHTTVAKIFTGTTLQVHSKNERTDMVTTFDLSDGQIAVRDSEMSLSYQPGTAGNNIIKAIAANMGLPVIFGEGAEFGTFANGYSFVGKGAEALNEICYGSGCTWSIQNDVLEIILNDGILTHSGIVFAPDSGLINSPERVVKASYKSDEQGQEEIQEVQQEEEPIPKRRRRRRRTTKRRTQRRKKRRKRIKKQAGWKIKTLLSPTISPGDAVKVESEIISGWFKVESIKHSGDSYGGDWVSEIELIERVIYAD